MSNEELVCSIKQGNTALMADLYMKNRKFIAAVVRHLKIKPENQEDAMQDAYFGLHAAVSRFDESKGYKFLTYAKDYIRVAIQRGQNNQLYVPEYIRHAANRIKRIRAELTQELKREPTAAEISEKTDYDTNTIIYILSIIKPVKSIYEPLDEDYTIGDTIEDKSINIENDTAFNDWIRYIRAVIQSVEMPQEEKETLYLHYYRNKKIKDIAAVKGLEEREINIYKQRGLRKLRKPNIIRQLKEIDIDRHTSFYNHVGVEKFNNTWTSTVERSVIIREHMRGNL